MPFHAHTLTPRFERLIQSALAELQATDLAVLARNVKVLSDFYVSHPGAPTPWSQPQTLPAYVAYFLPLNFVRLNAVWTELTRFLPDNFYSEIWDFGSGLGTTQWILEEQLNVAPRPFYCVESEAPAIQQHRKMCEKFWGQWSPRFESRAKPGPRALAVFSYSFLEMQKHLPNLEEFDHLVILEPSFRETARRLMEWRARLMASGFHPLAPCTHEQDCPLLVHSKTDWCHNRISFEPPEWWAELEAHLPMKNRTLTYSYLIMSRFERAAKWSGTARVIGDTLKEKGKTRQMVCRGPNREFLSWLHRFGEPPDIPHGALVRGLENAEVKGSELRLESEVLTVVNDDPAVRK